MSNKKYEQTIKITTQFDPSEVINGLKQIQQMAASSKGYNPQYFKTVTSNLTQAEALAKKLSELMQKGFTSPDDVRALKDVSNEFKKMASIVSEDLTVGIRRGFEDFSRTVSSTTSQLESDLKKIKEQIANTLTEKGVSGLKLKIDSSIMNLSEAINSIVKGNISLEKVNQAILASENELLRIYNKKIEAQEEIISKKETSLTSAKEEKQNIESQKGELTRLENTLATLRKISVESAFPTAGAFLNFFQGLQSEKSYLSILEQGGNIGGKVGENFLEEFQETIKKGLLASKATNKKNLIQDLLGTTFEGQTYTLGEFFKSNNIFQKDFESYLTELMKVPVKARSTFQQVTQQVEELKTKIGDTSALDKINKKIQNLENDLQKAKDKRDEILTEGQTKFGFIQSAKALLTPSSDFTSLVGSAIAAQDNLNKKQEEGNNAIDNEKMAREILLRLLEDQVKLTGRNVSALNDEANKAQTLGQIATNVNTTFNQLSSRLSYFVSIFTVFRKVRQVIKQTFTDVQNLDKAFSSIAMVTTNTVSGLWKQYSQYADIANRLGQTTQSAIEASALYVQQGLDMVQAMELTESTLKLATLSQQDFKTTTKQLTSALRGFNMEMSEADHVTDVYSELAAHAAANVQEIAYSMSKVASIAASSGAKFENIAAFLTQMIS